MNKKPIPKDDLYALPPRALITSNLHPGSIVLWCLLDIKQLDSDYHYRSQQVVADELGVQPRTVGRWAEELRAAGLVAITTGPLRATGIGMDACYPVLSERRAYKNEKGKRIAFPVYVDDDGGEVPYNGAFHYWVTHSPKRGKVSEALNLTPAIRRARSDRVTYPGAQNARQGNGAATRSAQDMSTEHVPRNARPHVPRSARPHVPRKWQDNQGNANKGNEG